MNQREDSFVSEKKETYPTITTTKKNRFNFDFKDKENVLNGNLLQFQV